MDGSRRGGLSAGAGSVGPVAGGRLGGNAGPLDGGNAVRTEVAGDPQSPFDVAADAVPEVGEVVAQRVAGAWDDPVAQAEEPVQHGVTQSDVLVDGLA
jgi:hypothetical protein